MVLTCDQVTSVLADQLHEPCGWFSEDQETSRHEAVRAALDLV